MEKFKKYLDSKKICYQDIKIGESYFFDHSLDLHFNAVSILFYYDPENRENARNAEKARKTVEKYCKRYGYTIFCRCGYANETRYNIAKSDDYRQLTNYHIFSDKANEKCNNHIHFCAQYYGNAGKNKNLNEELKGIMSFYEDEYKRFLNGEEINKEYYNIA